MLTLNFCILLNLCVRFHARRIMHSARLPSSVCLSGVLLLLLLLITCIERVFNSGSRIFRLYLWMGCMRVYRLGRKLLWQASHSGLLVVRCRYADLSRSLMIFDLLLTCFEGVFVLFIAWSHRATSRSIGRHGSQRVSNFHLYGTV